VPTIGTPTRERIDADTQEVQDALWKVVFSSPGVGRHKVVFVHDAASGEIEARAEAVDPQTWPEVRWDRYRQFRSAIRRLAEDAGWQDNELARELLDQTLELQERLEADPDGTDPGWKVKEVADQIVDLLLAIQRETEHSALDDAPTAARYVIDQLAGIDQDELARLFGVDARTVRDWKADKTRTIRKNPERVTLIAQLVYDLRRAMTPRGIVRWFKRDRSQLEGRTPLELIDADVDVAAEALRPLARGVRGQLGS
jgi:transcriptional regulator with XRE-family HTH domain